MRNVYEVLGVDYTASVAEVKQARNRRLAELAETARVDPVAKAEQDRVLAAWETLKTPSGRAAYDDGLVFDAEPAVVEDDPVDDEGVSDSERLAALGALVGAKRAAASRAAGFEPPSVRAAARRSAAGAGVRASDAGAVLRSPFDAGGWSAAAAQAAVAVFVVSLLVFVAATWFCWRPDLGGGPDRRPIAELIEEAGRAS